MFFMSGGKFNKAILIMKKLLTTLAIISLTSTANAFDSRQTFDYPKSHKFTYSDWNATFVRV